MKTPEEYFQETVTPPEKAKVDQKLSEAEKAFLEKYVGLEQSAILAKMQPVEPERDETLAGFAPPRPKPVVPVVLAEAPAAAKTEAPVEVPVQAPAPAPVKAAPAEPDMDELLRREPELQLVSFFIGKQEYALPIITIQEVIRFIAPTKLPEAPAFLAGIVNLRGRVTPLISLKVLLDLPETGEDDRFIIVCRHKGLQVGLLVSRVATMYRAPQEKMEWGLETRIGIKSSFLSGLMKAEGRLINILSVERLVARVMGT
jgi:purine-binding chemotaxis protein CheW